VENTFDGQGTRVIVATNRVTSVDIQTLTSPASFFIGRGIRSLTSYADDESTCSTSYKAGLLSGLAAQAGIVGVSSAVAAGGASFARASFLAARFAVAGGDLTGATAVENETIEALYTVGDLVSDSVTEAARNAIRAASTLRSTTPVLW
jgi:hypothetical protein